MRPDKCLDERVDPVIKQTRASVRSRIDLKRRRHGHAAQQASLRRVLSPRSTVAGFDIDSFITDSADCLTRLLIDSARHRHGHKHTTTLEIMEWKLTFHALGTVLFPPAHRVGERSARAGRDQNLPGSATDQQKQANSRNNNGDNNTRQSDCNEHSIRSISLSA